MLYMYPDTVLRTCTWGWYDYINKLDWFEVSLPVFFEVGSYTMVCFDPASKDKGSTRGWIRSKWRTLHASCTFGNSTADNDWLQLAPSQGSDPIGTL